MGPRSTLGASAADLEMEAARSYLRLAHPSPAAPVVEASAPQPDRGFVLESVAEGTAGLRLMPIHPLPFRIGRRPGLELVLPSHRVSKLHAEIFEQDGVLKIRDQQSRNGTFVNHRPVIESRDRGGRHPPLRRLRVPHRTKDAQGAARRQLGDRDLHALLLVAPVPRGRARPQGADRDACRHRRVPVDRAHARRERRGLRGARPRPPPRPAHAARWSSCGSRRASEPRSSCRA